MELKAPISPVEWDSVRFIKFAATEETKKKDTGGKSVIGDNKTVNSENVLQTMESLIIIALYCIFLFSQSVKSIV